MSEKRVALVTGASKGVGRGIALGLAADGWDVAINFHGDRDGAMDTAETVRGHGRNAWVLQGNVGVSDDVVRMFEELDAAAGRIDLLVNNAGVQTWAPLLELKEADWDRTLATNLKGTFLCTQQAALRMKQQGSGGIINIGSGANKRPFPKLVDYGASKGGIERLTKVSAVELGPLGIRVNCVAPGAIEIERTKHEAPNYAETWAPRTPLRRVGQVEDVAHMVVFLASNKASFVTGQTIYTDGGLFTQGPWPEEY
ncbi:MAG: 3-oxoacyl-ACP reductase FabG [Planctomycetales bacterium]|nr:3-oxoacyl-ACP reductase FabG [Planctomycetales bacterium]